MDTASTKEKIIDAAIVMFSERGYDQVSMRDIAKTVGIKASSIYNHFLSKREILMSIYEFYSRERRLVFPDMEKVLKRLETEPVANVVGALAYYWPPGLQDRMDRIILIADQRIYLDKDSEKFIRDHFFEPLRGMWILFLTRAIELGKIEPLDIDAFTYLAVYYAFSAAELNRTSMKVSKEQWVKGLDMIYSILKLKRVEKSAS